MDYTLRPAMRPKSFDLALHDVITTFQAKAIDTRRLAIAGFRLEPYRGDYRVIADPRDPRDPDHTKTGIFVYHNCWRCADGELPCPRGNPNQCDYPRARND